MMADPGVTAAIVAGGMGTRLGGVSAGRPKCLVEVAGKPVLQHQLEFLRREGISRAVLLTGVGAAEIEQFVGDGSRFGLDLRCVAEDTPLGTAGAFSARRGLPEETLLVLYGDVLCNFDLRRFLDFHHARRAEASIFAHPNDHPFDSDLLEVGIDDRLVTVHHKPHPAGAELGNLVNAAIYLLEPRFRRFVPDGPCDWARDTFPAALQHDGSIHVYRSSEYAKDMGTPERLRQVEADVVSGRVASSSYRHARPACFLDRDGTLNRLVGHCARREELELLPGAAEAVRAINRHGFLAIVITNQPVVARGICTEEQLKGIHHRLESLLGDGEAYLDRIEYCPHHPDEGYAGENPAYKIECHCRKPGLGLIERATAEENIDLSRSVMIGDSTRDVETGRRAGLITFLLKTGEGGADGVYPAEPTFRAPTLLDAIERLLQVVPE